MKIDCTTQNDENAFFPLFLFRSHLAGLLFILGMLYYSSLHSYLLFHSLIELFSILVFFGIFIIAWNVRHVIQSHYLLFLGIAYFFIGIIDLEHTLAYKGMGILAHSADADHATKLWIGARYTESVVLLAAPFFLRRRIRVGMVFTLFFIGTFLLLWAIHNGVFPSCFKEESGLTPFKKNSEYLISTLLAAGFVLLHHWRRLLDGKVYRLLAASVLFTIASELAFTFYVNVYGLSNLFGHFFKFISAYLMYLALIETGLKTPYTLLFHELNEKAELLAAREQEFRVIFELSAVGMAKIEPFSGRFVLVNRKLCRITGYEMNEMLTMTSEEITHPDDRERSREAFSGYLRKESGTFQIEKRCLRKNGEIIWVRVTVNIVHDDMEEPLYYIGIIEDITDSRMLAKQEKLRKEELEKEVALRTAELADSMEQLRILALQISEIENRERRRIAAYLHDDLQQLLAAANMHLGRLTAVIDPDRRHNATVIENILREAIEASRSLSHDLSPPILHQGSLKAIFEWLVTRKQKNYGFKVKLTMPDDLQLESDIMRVFLYRSVQELLFNVVKHAGTNEAAVTVKMEEGDKLLVEVADKGRGIEPGKLQGSEFSGELGFGIFSIRERLQLLGGALSVEGGPGKGSRFVMHLPLSGTAVPVPLPRENHDYIIGGIDQYRPVSPAPAMSREKLLIRVLIADDHEILRHGLVSLLRDEQDIEIVGQANNGSEAVRLVGERRPDVVIMDMTMPDMDGVEATERISRKYPEVAVIANSMHENQALMEAAGDAGALTYCTKSGSTVQLLAAIREKGRLAAYRN